MTAERSGSGAARPVGQEKRGAALERALHLTRLATSARTHERRFAATHPNTPRGVLSLLQRAGSSADLTTLGVTDPTLEPITLCALARLGPWARLLVAHHPRAPEALLRRLALDDDPTVRRAALLHPELSGWWARCLNDVLAGRLPVHLLGTPDDLAAYGVYAAWLVAQSPAVSRGLLFRLLRHDHRAVRRAALAALLPGRTVVPAPARTLEELLGC
ncbi:hypothetical protein GCM10008949_47050 [Deinococcus humi]|nr:hypothetical protein GCM10008949_47050 [Deinococcus humi]